MCTPPSMSSSSRPYSPSGAVAKLALLARLDDRIEYPPPCPVELSAAGYDDGGFRTACISNCCCVASGDRNGRDCGDSGISYVGIGCVARTVRMLARVVATLERRLGGVLVISPDGMRYFGDGIGDG